MLIIVKYIGSLSNNNGLNYLKFLDVPIVFTENSLLGLIKADAFITTITCKQPCIINYYYKKPIHLTS